MKRIVLLYLTDDNGNSRSNPNGYSLFTFNPLVRGFSQIDSEKNSLSTPVIDHASRTAFFEPAQDELQPCIDLTSLSPLAKSSLSDVSNNDNRNRDSSLQSKDANDYSLISSPLRNITNGTSPNDSSSSMSDNDSTHERFAVRASICMLYFLISFIRFLSILIMLTFQDEKSHFVNLKT